MAALYSFIVTPNDRYAHDSRDRTAVTRWRRPWIRVAQQNRVALCGFCGQKLWQQRIFTKKRCPCTVNVACHVKQSIFGCRSSRNGEEVSKTNIESVGSVTWFRQQPQEFYATGFQGLVKRWDKFFKFAWRLRWKINVVCMSLSPFVSLHQGLLTYLLTFFRICPFILYH